MWIPHSNSPGGRKYPGNDFFPELPTIRGVFAGETPWSSRFEVRVDDDDHDSYPRPALRRDWHDEGIRAGPGGRGALDRRRRVTDGAGAVL